MTRQDDNIAQTELLGIGLRSSSVSRAFGRVADPVHFRPDPAPDPANQTFKIGSGSYWHIKHISSDI